MQQKEYLERALAIKERHYGKDNYLTATTLMNLGNVCGALGDMRKKIEYLSKALTLHTSHYGSESYAPSIGITLLNLGFAYEALNNRAKAAGCYERSYRIFLHCHGPLHDRTQLAKSQLEALDPSNSALTQGGLFRWPNESDAADAVHGPRSRATPK